MQRKPFRYAWLIATLIATTLACNLLTGLGRDIREVRETGASVATQGAPMIKTFQAFATNEGGSLLKTGQAYATQNPGLLETGKAFATEGLPELKETLEAAMTDNPQVLVTLNALATDRPDVLATISALATRYARGGSFKDIPEDIPMVDQNSITDLYVAEAIITYSTTLDFKTVLDFYKEQMPANGWEADDSGTFESGNTAMLKFEKADRTVNMILTGEASNSRVSVVIQISSK